MLVSIAGHADPQYGLADFSFGVGEVVELDKTLAAAWIDAGHAEKAKGSDPVGPAAEPAKEGE